MSPIVCQNHIEAIAAIVPKTAEYDHLLGHISARTLWLLPIAHNRAVANSLLRNLAFAVVRDVESFSTNPLPALVALAKWAALDFFAPHVQHRFARDEGREGIALAAFCADASKVRGRLELIATLPGFSVNAPVSFVEDEHDWRAQGGVIHTLVFLIGEALVAAAIDTDAKAVHRALTLTDALDWALAQPDADAAAPNAAGRAPCDIAATAQRALEGFAEEAAILEEIVCAVRARARAFPMGAVST